jgi:hypothetical protein
VLVCCGVNQISLLEVPSGKELRRLRIGPPFLLSYSPRLALAYEQKLLVAGCFPDTHFAGILNLETGKVLATVECGPLLSVCKSVGIAPDGRTLVTKLSGVNRKDRPVGTNEPLKLWRLPAKW